MRTSDWTAAQKNVVLACFLAWALDAFDFFLLVFVLGTIARDFGSSVERVTLAITLTLAMRPLGAFLFGRLADRYGRRSTLMLNVLMYSALEFASALAPSLGVFLLLRALYGIAMGGVWGVGTALAFESVPVKARGVVSGLLQAGYPTGYLIASVVFGLLFSHIGWRGMFMVGALPALIVLHIRTKVSESPTWKARAREPVRFWRVLGAHWHYALYAIVLMTAFNFFSHGTQDLYPHFLQTQRQFSNGTVSVITVIYNVGAICGGLLFGTLSSRIGRRRAIMLAAVLALPALPLWAFATTPMLVAAGAFLMQVGVQGAWGVVPVHLNELSPDAIRSTFPGVVYQLGNFIASVNAPLQVIMANHFGSPARPDYAAALALVAAVVAVLIVLLACFGPERRDVAFGRTGP
jgi:SHS family lactate transporter-like MFS transporter